MGKAKGRAESESSLFGEEHYQLRSKSGYDFYEVSSALQKSLRRGLEEDAMYWAIELEEKFFNYLWKRMIIISHEDVGIVSMEVIQFVETCHSQYEWLRSQKNDRHRMLVLGNAVLAICRAQKTRIGDDFLYITLKTPHALDKKPIPDYALDAHTLRGKMLGRGWEKEGNEFWFSESSKINNEVEGFNNYLPMRRKRIMGE